MFSNYSVDPFLAGQIAGESILLSLLQFSVLAPSNSLGIRNLVPYTIYASATWVSWLTAILRHSSMRKTFCVYTLALVCHNGCFHRLVESLYHAICLRVVRCTYFDDTKSFGQSCEQPTLELSSLVTGNPYWCSESTDPKLQQYICNCFCCYFWL